MSMSRPLPTLFARAPVPDRPAMPGGRRLTVDCRVGLGIAAVLVRNARSASLAARVREHFRIELPQEPRRTTAGNVAFAGTGPGAWLVSCEGGGSTFAVSLKEAIGDLASVSDQSDAYAVLHLVGPKVRDVLCKLVPVDVHPRSFGVGDVAVTLANQINAILWRSEDRTEGLPVFEIAVFRSLARSLWQELTDAAAGLGDPAL